MARVLVVDDDETVRLLLHAHLKQAGHRVLEMASGDAAIASVRENGIPDVAVIDISLPGMDGYELAGKLRVETGRLELPVIFLSASVDEEHIHRGRELGAAYLTKPYVRTALLSAVEGALAEPDGW